MDIKIHFLLSFLTLAYKVHGNAAQGVNVAAGKPASLGGYRKTHLTDGQTGFCTIIRDNSPIVVDLGNLYSLQSVKVFGSRSSSAKNIEVRVIKSASQDPCRPHLKTKAEEEVVCSSDSSGPPAFPYVANCTASSNIVTIQRKRNDGERFSICEIEVYGKLKSDISPKPPVIDKPILKPNLRLRNSLMAGISTIPLPYAPMQVLVVRKKATPLFVKPSTRECVLAASTVGRGRVIVSGERQFIHQIQFGRELIWYRLKKWLAKGANPYFVHADRMYSESQFPRPGGIILWTQYHSVSPSIRALILRLLRSGRVGVFTGDRQHNVERFYGPYQEILDEAGVVLINKYGNWHPTKWTTRGFDDFSLVSVEQQLEFMLAKTKYHLKYLPELLDDLTEVSPKMLKEINAGQKLSQLVDLYEPYMKETYPCVKRPSKTDLQKQYNTFFSRLMLTGGLANTNKAAPNADVFPGLPGKNAIEETVRIKFIGTNEGEAHSTGLYLPPGKTLKIKIVSPKTDLNHWYVRVGCHTDDVGRWRPEWHRYRVIATREIPVLFGEVFSGFGGVVWIINKKKNTQVTLEISGAIRAPYFNLRDSKNLQEWDTKGRHYQAPWAEIASDKFIFCLPSSKVTIYDRKYLEDLMTNIWDFAVKANFWMALGQWKERRRERMTIDVQISAGGGHAGYPIMAHYYWIPWMVNKQHITTIGSWGVSHELGHNIQAKPWTFWGSGEVTCNIFSIFNQYLWRLNFFAFNTEQLQGTKRYLDDGPTMEKWAKDHYNALSVYKQTALYFGWEAYVKAFSIYIKRNINPNNDQEKRDKWVALVSEVVGRNVCPMYDFWGFQVSSKTVDYLKRRYREAFLPDDILTQQSPERVKFILNQYRNHYVNRTSATPGLNGGVREKVKDFPKTLLPNDVIYL